MNLIYDAGTPPRVRRASHVLNNYSDGFPRNTEVLLSRVHTARVPDDLSDECVENARRRAYTASGSFSLCSPARLEDLMGCHPAQGFHL